MVIDYPYIEEFKQGYHIRTFLENTPDNELKWHFDEEDRIVVCEHYTDWLFQMDNELPVKIVKDKPIFIPEGKYHRILKGTGDLVVKVKKLNNR